ncbi:hypothetical protein ASPFODRAFT_53503 [Aspergillus luchuensis CBS 106.47]|uniref:Uncharacterized protein n=1 Tax=Aspergillus luchuensis (strain CBS 106.47) TaxID=1137211 RepID=A0A1M3T0R5_ASPLC|nr:hypothetical protein ASPFODRAFT_53503 [Aspergillus luchuensis CBS 106.47]
MPDIVLDLLHEAVETNKRSSMARGGPFHPPREYASLETPILLTGRLSDRDKQNQLPYQWRATTRLKRLGFGMVYHLL